MDRHASLQRTAAALGQVREQQALAQHRVGLSANALRLAAGPAAIFCGKTLNYDSSGMSELCRLRRNYGAMSRRAFGCMGRIFSRPVAK